MRTDNARTIQRTAVSVALCKHTACKPLADRTAARRSIVASGYASDAGRTAPCQHEHEDPA